MKIRKVIIPVAGLGTRFLPATKVQPKEMLTIVDKPVIQYLVEEAVNSGIREVIFVIGERKRVIVYNNPIVNVRSWLQNAGFYSDSA